MSTTRQAQFEKEVTTKFNIYNSLFLSLPFSTVSNIGMLIPLLLRESKLGLAQGQNPADILAAFFDKHTLLQTEKERIDFMFSVIQYVERQVVLYDSVEDAAFSDLHADDAPLKPQPKYLVKNRTGINPRKVADNNTFLKYFISPIPLNIPSKTKATVFTGRLRIRM